MQGTNSIGAMVTFSDEGFVKSLKEDQKYLKMKNHEE